MSSTPPPSKRTHRLPATFRSLGTLRVLNVLALATSLAAATGSVFGRVFGSHDQSAITATALSTFVFGLAWAIAMRARKRLGKTKVRVGWLASIPLAAMNGGTACALLMVVEDGSGAGADQFVRGFLLGATFGAIMWVPGLLAVLGLYGVPIATSQSLAEKGLAGEERGERIVGVVSAVIAAVALAILPGSTTDLYQQSTFGALGRALVMTFAGLGGLSGVVAAVLATYRDRVRKGFVREVEAGAVQGFRVDTTNEGKVLVRVTSQGGGYRAATFDEQVYGLDEGGDARRALSGEP